MGMRERLQHDLPNSSAGLRADQIGLKLFQKQFDRLRGHKPYSKQQIRAILMKVNVSGAASRAVLEDGAGRGS